jgi:NodT family efflux transporter outer membrane factor (OMF) lipoprotein
MKSVKPKHDLPSHRDGQGILSSSKLRAGSYRSPFRRSQIAILVAAALLANGCTTLGPDFRTPEAQVEQQWLEANDAKVKTTEGNFRNWWTNFDDPILNSLVQKAYQQNLDLQVAGIRILEARAQLGIAVGSQYPQVQQGLGSLTYERLSRESPNFSPGIDNEYWTSAIGFDATWEIDFWGRFRRAIESADANLIASVASYDDFLVTLIAEVARTYVIIRTLQALIDVQLQNVKVQERSLEIARVRFENGAVTELDVQQATTLLRDTEATVPDLRRQLRQAQNALSILLGQPPENLEPVLGVQPIPAAPASVAVGIPADLLRRRPDVRQAELQAAAQSAQIGVAVTDLYPRFSLFGNIGLVASDSGNQSMDILDFSDSWAFTGGPQFSWAILNYGRLKNNIRVQDARLQQFLVSYQNTVLEAAQEVEDGLVGFLRFQDQAGFLEDSVTAARRSVDLALIQYRDGAVDFQRVLDTQRELLNAQNRLVSSQGNVATSLVGTYKALGGGWEQRLGNDFVSESNRAQMRARTDWGELLAPEKVPETVELPPRAEDIPLFNRPDW